MRLLHLVSNLPEIYIMLTAFIELQEDLGFVVIGTVYHVAIDIVEQCGWNCEFFASSICMEC